MTDNYDYLADLTIDTKTGLYNLFLTTYNGSRVSLNVFICGRKHEMRMDLISNEIYNSTKYAGTICQLNNILNPFSIKEGDILLYTTREEADGLRKVTNDIKQTDIDNLFSAVKNDLINAYKKRRRDPDGRGFFNRRPDSDNLPPTILLDDRPQIVIDNNLIRVSPNLFPNPNLGVIDATPGNIVNSGNIDNSGNNNLGGLQNDNIERVLVRRYIRKINDN